MLDKLKKTIKDEKIIYLITLFLKNGTLFKGKWQDKLEGVYQGDVLSPFLSNIYLHSFDKFLEYLEIEFVRFSDDLIFFAKEYQDAKYILKKAKNYLANKLKLQLNEEKTYITHKNKPFAYLGVIFDEKNSLYSIENERLMQKISKISQETKDLNLNDTIIKLNEHIQGFHNYYLKVINNTKQFELLQEKEEQIIIDKIIKAKQSKKITNKKEFQKILTPLLSYVPKENFASYLIQKAYEELKFKSPIKSAQKDIAHKKTLYTKNYLKQTELIISKIGSSIYYSQGKIKIRSKDEPIKAIPFHKVSRIIITTTRASISLYLINKCAKEKIDIDFIEKNTPYAMLTSFKNISQELHLKQLELISSQKGVNFAKSLLYAKAKNQINLLKYFNARRDEEKINTNIKIMNLLVNKLKSQNNTKSLMGYEGQISQLYWNSVAIIINKPNFQRTHKDSVDVINQALNYGYAIVYNRVQSALIREGLNIYYSFLHTQATKKPTLTFDMIEPFRSPIVDREIISILTKKQKLKQNSKKLLSPDSIKIIIQNIQERLSTPTKSKYGKTTYQNIIYLEANSLKHAILSKKQKHKFFIAKY